MRVKTVKPTGVVSTLGKTATFGMVYGARSTRLWEVQALIAGDAVCYHGNYGIVRRHVGGGRYYVEFLHPRVWYADFHVEQLLKIDGGILAIMALSSES